MKPLLLALVLAAAAGAQTALDTAVQANPSHVHAAAEFTLGHVDWMFHSYDRAVAGGLGYRVASLSISGLDLSATPFVEIATRSYLSAGVAGGVLFHAETARWSAAVAASNDWSVFLARHLGAFDLFGRYAVEKGGGANWHPRHTPLRFSLAAYKGFGLMGGLELHFRDN